MSLRDDSPTVSATDLLRLPVPIFGGKVQIVTPRLIATAAAALYWRNVGTSSVHEANALLDGWAIRFYGQTTFFDLLATTEAQRH